MDLILMPSALETASVPAYGECDFAVLEFCWRTDMHIDMPVASGLECLSRKISDIKLAGLGFGGGDGGLFHVLSAIWFGFGEDSLLPPVGSRGRREPSSRYSPISATGVFSASAYTSTGRTMQVSTVPPFAIRLATTAAASDASANVPIRLGERR